MIEETKYALEDWDSLDVPIVQEIGEPSDAYQAFLQFAWEQYADRNIARVAQITKYPESRIASWHKNWNWEERASMVDSIRWKYEFRQREKELAKENAEIAQRNRSIKEKGLQITEKMLTVAQNLLNSAELVDEMVESDFVDTADGRRVPTMTVIKMKSKISDIPRLVETAVRTNNLVQGLPTEIVETVSLDSVDLENLSYEQLKQLKEKNEKDLKSLRSAQEISTLEQ